MRITASADSLNVDGEELGERALTVRGPNGLIIERVDWNAQGGPGRG
jgi:hypothetical protein